MQGSFGYNEPHLQRQDIKTMIDVLTHLEVYPSDEHIVDSAITILEDLGNLVSKLQLENANIKQELKDINKAIDDPAVDLTLTASECILNMKKDIINLKHEISFLESIIFLKQ